MVSLSEEVLEMLDEPDREKVKYFARILLKQEKYKSLKKEIEERRKEVSEGEVLSHDEFWKDVDV